jgi:DNA (cytosine-5)-methyltransferase 1
VTTVPYDHRVGPTAVDLFAGAGGATQGLRQAGVNVAAAVESESRAAASYRLNHPTVLLKEQDIRSIDAVRLRRELRLRPGQLDLLKACPPCQGFSTLARGDIDETRNDLVLDVMRFVIAFRPKVVALENVPGLRRDPRLTMLCDSLRDALGYRFRSYLVDASALGVPQRRKRLIVLGVSRRLRCAPPEDLLDLLPASFSRDVVTVDEAFAALARTAVESDPLDRYRQLTPTVQKRVAAVPRNGTRFDLPDELVLPCHRKLGIRTRTATTSYGRMRLDAPSPTMTTRCTTPACGRFIHPTENRGITLREAATLQSFPVGYMFSGDYGSIERQIGNAVPVRLAEAIGLIMRRLCRLGPPSDSGMHNS